MSFLDPDDEPNSDWGFYITFGLIVIVGLAAYFAVMFFDLL